MQDDCDKTIKRAAYDLAVEAIANGVDVPAERIASLCNDAGISLQQFDADLSAAGRAAGEASLQEIIDDAKAKAWSKGWQPGHD